jgi:hypothetical protein
MKELNDQISLQEYNGTNFLVHEIRLKRYEVITADYTPNDIA